ncbi:MAG TPA: putative bifunctional diguanylate cyclase/phosphodiesterase, partial [Candidatus Brocadiaceae bacterium]
MMQFYIKDRDSKYVSCNENYARNLKIMANEIVGKTDYDFYPEELADKYMADDRRIIESGQALEIQEKHIKDGRELFINTIKTPLRDEKDNITGVVGIFWDITDRKQMEDRIQKLSLATEQSPNMVMITDTAGNVEYINRKFTEITGYALEEVVGKNPRILKSGKTPPLKQLMLWASITAGREWRGEMINKKKSGELYWVRISISPIKDPMGFVTHFVGLSEDITERKKNEERLIFLAEHDPLTHLHNRRYFVEQLENWIAQMKRREESGVLILVDLDNFKYVNDTLGHQEGDMLLIKIAEVLRKQVRETDVVARLGGDEFAIILPFTTQEQVQAVSGRILLSIKEYCRIDKISGYGITVSIGIVQFPEYGDNATLLLSCADIAMYTAKEEGRNRICVFEPKHKAKMDLRLVWEHRIQKALKEDLFVLYLQPIYDIRKEIVCGYEVLLRMLGENREIIMPNDFLPVAERHGLIHEIDHWVIRESMRLFVAYKVSKKGLFLDINLSGKA